MTSSFISFCGDGKLILSIKKNTKNINKSNNIDLIIVNDGSDDDYTLNVLSKLSNVRIFYQKNSGLSSARNRGLANAKGNYVFFLDADDWIEIDAISKMMECMKYSNSSIIFSDTILEGESKGLRKKNYNFFEQLFINHIPYYFSHETDLKGNPSNDYVGKIYLLIIITILYINK